MEKQKKKNSSFFSAILFWSLIIATVLSIIFSAYCNPIFVLNENQLLYLFSTMAQVIGGVFGLTLTAYVFFVDKFKESTQDDEILYDAAAALLSRYFHTLILIALICGSIIFLCVTGIIVLHNWMAICPFVINESVFLFLIDITAILIFGTMLLDPEKLDKEISRMKKGAEEYYQSSSSKPGDFRAFLKNYNLLERVIIDFAQECLKAPNQYRYNYKPQIIQSLKVLVLNEIIDGSLLDEINELRMYRNGLVHGVDFDVTQDACDRISEIYDALLYVFDVFKNHEKNSEEMREALKKVYDLTHYCSGE